MRNYEKHYTQLLLSTDPADLSLVSPPALYKGFYNNDNTFSVAKLDGYLKASITLFKLAMTDTNNTLYTQEDLTQMEHHINDLKYILSLSKEEKETEVKKAMNQTSDPIDASISTITCPNCNNSKFTYIPTDNKYKCQNCNTVYTREDLIKIQGEFYGKA